MKILAYAHSAATLALSAFAVTSSAFAEERYDFQTMICSGATSPGVQISDDFRYVALRIERKPQVITDALGQTRRIDLVWTSAVGRSAEAAEAGLRNKDRSPFKLSVGMPILIPGKPLTIAFPTRRGEDLHLVATSRQGRVDEFDGVYFDDGITTYQVRCVATRS